MRAMRANLGETKKTHCRERSVDFRAVDYDIGFTYVRNMKNILTYNYCIQDDSSNWTEL